MCVGGGEAVAADLDVRTSGSSLASQRKYGWLVQNVPTSSAAGLNVAAFGASQVPVILTGKGRSMLTLG